ncbi:MAG: 4Fe-4S binding protein [Candidatus Lokiarchaeota archaeon]|nr:4Fe-4S binding protein [Candidatus Lokiarchaeota archaeon]
MVTRDIIKIDKEKCTGCGQCASGCPEGAIQVIDGKARLVSAILCDGLGACIGTCPEGAISVEKREAEPYDESKVIVNIIEQGPNTIKAHLKHLDEHKQAKYLEQALDYLKEKKIAIPDYKHEEAAACGCPSSVARTMARKDNLAGTDGQPVAAPSQLHTWPVQLTLVSAAADYFDDADLLIAADCTAYAYGNFHQDFIKDKVTIIFCPKLDARIEDYVEKLADIIKNHSIKSITIVHMQVPCCFGLVKVVDEAIKQSGKKMTVKEAIISMQGEILPPVAKFFMQRH